MKYFVHKYTSYGILKLDVDEFLNMKLRIDIIIFCMILVVGMTCCTSTTMIYIN